MRVKTLLKTELSRRRVLGAGAVAACAAALSGCANVIAGGAKYDASDLAADPTLLVATNRKPVAGARGALVRRGTRHAERGARHTHAPGRRTVFTRLGRAGPLARRQGRAARRCRRFVPVGAAARRVAVRARIQHNL